VAAGAATFYPEPGEGPNKTFSHRKNKANYIFLSYIFEKSEIISPLQLRLCKQEIKILNVIVSFNFQITFCHYRTSYTEIFHITKGSLYLSAFINRRNSSF
jgi:hypothetical protein